MKNIVIYTACRVISLSGAEARILFDRQVDEQVVSHWHYNVTRSSLERWYRLVGQIARESHAWLKLGYDWTAIFPAKPCKRV